jgi:hypothetical protein
MDSTLKTLKVSLQAIRDTALEALNEIEQSPQDYSMRWQCTGCQYMKHFTKPVPLEAAGRCLDAKAQNLRLFCDRA